MDWEKGGMYFSNDTQVMYLKTLLDRAEYNRVGAGGVPIIDNRVYLILLSI